MESEGVLVKIRAILMVIAGLELSVYADESSLAARGPKELPYAGTGSVIPEGYRPVHRFDGVMVATGFATFGIAYRSAVTTVIRSLIFETRSETNAKLPLLIPIVGPLLVTARERQPIEVMFGGVQFVGVSLLTLGFLLPKTFLLRNDYKKSTLSPFIGGRTVGLEGTF
jgi:hypothetical protein